MNLLLRFVRILFRTPRRFLFLGAIVFLILGTCFWSVWKLPDWVPVFPLKNNNNNKNGDQSLMDSPPTNDNSSGGSLLFLPEPPNCIQDYVPARPKYPKQYCIWNVTHPKNCTDMMMHLKEQALKSSSSSSSSSSSQQQQQQQQRPSLSLLTSMVFLGDAHMAKLAQYTSMNWPSSDGILPPLNVTTTRRHPCQNLAYYGLPPPNHDWIPPNPIKGEGPMMITTSTRTNNNNNNNNNVNVNNNNQNRYRPYCTNCKKCWNLIMQPSTSISSTSTNNNNNNNNKDDSSNDDYYLEYLVMEYSRDVTIPTIVTNTTQETAAYYLSRKKTTKTKHSQKPQICITTTGMNDAAIVPPISMDIYITNADKYLALLQRTCQTVLWMNIHAIVEQQHEQQEPQNMNTNDNIINHDLSTTITSSTSTTTTTSIFQQSQSQQQQTNCKFQKWNNAMLGQISMIRQYNNVYYMDIWETSLKTNHEGYFGLDKSFYMELSKIFF